MQSLMTLAIHVAMMAWIVWMYARLGNLFLLRRFTEPGPHRAWGAFFALLLVLTQYCVATYSRGFVRFAVYAAFALWMYRGNLAKKLMVLLLFIALVMVGEALTMTMIGLLRIEAWVDLNGITFMTCWFVWLMLGLTRNVKQIIDSHLSWRTWLKIAYCAGCSLLLANQLWYLYYRYIVKGGEGYDFTLSAPNVLSAVLVLMQLGAVYALFSIVYAMNRDLEALGRSRMDQLKVSQDLERNRTMMETAERYHRLQHDMKNHLLAIDALCGDAERQRAYIAKLTGDQDSPA